MRWTKRSLKLISEVWNDPWMDTKTKHLYADYYDEFECDICGAEPLEDCAEFICSVARPGCGAYWAIRYGVCLDCANGGIANFPDRLRKHAETLEGRARELRKLADAEWRTPGPEDGRPIQRR